MGFQGVAQGIPGTVRALVEQGLRWVIERREGSPFKLRDASFKGKGLQPEVLEGQWDPEAVYGSRGG